jgi:hypothetical protein
METAWASSTLDAELEHSKARRKCSSGWPRVLTGGNEKSDIGSYWCVYSYRPAVSGFRANRTSEAFDPTAVIGPS